MNVELTGFDIGIFEEIKNGRTDFLVKANGFESVELQILSAINKLRLNCFLTGDVYSDAEVTGYKNIQLTKIGYRYFMSDEERQADVQKERDELLKQ
ncbi:hypothetical protein D1B33_06125 [Lysinibacillus yapensis]|uniref:Uncharacterized protein n=1 Tax=Ureibacillus yapensis TaxID=2304605 RepID=A0A396SIB0_9BACL|nr:hypothetical protein [Lysinibacillus yapensis]RHW38455.1 hypothetical protein D1B33_06125 [Lysinibacillus yapensis]